MEQVGQVEQVIGGQPAEMPEGAGKSPPHQALLAALALPAEARVDQRVPKKLLLENGAPTAAEAINRKKRMALVDGIKYQRLGDQHYYSQELFQQEELTGYLKNMLEDTHKSVYEHVVYDSDAERAFADGLEKQAAVKVYAKLPGWFRVPTPLGTYNPDWAVVVEQDGAERLYFVVETKGSLSTDDLRGKEDAKIRCGAAHFRTIAVREKPAMYVTARNVDDLMAHC